MSHLKDSFLKTVRSEREGLANCLRLYFAVDKVPLVYDLVRQHILSPVFRKIINEESLQNEPSELDGIYQKVLAFIESDLKYLLDVTQPSPGYVELGYFSSTKCEF